MRIYDSLIFDLDGTLWDSTAACAEGWNRALHELNVIRKPLSSDDIKPMMGMANPELFSKVFPEVSETERAKTAERCLHHELDVIQQAGAPLFPGVGAGISQLTLSYPLFIVSNCDEPYLDLFLKATGWLKVFKDWECYGRTQRPKTENIQSVVKRNHLKSPAYIGDTLGDESAARQASVDFFHAAYGFGRAERPLAAFQDFDQLVLYFSKGL